VTNQSAQSLKHFRELPSALKEREKIFQKLADKTPAIFLDYDGTLSPIAKHPEDAILTEEMRTALKKLAERCALSIVSGRDRADVANLVGLKELIYAGSHGFDITGPDNLHMQHEGGKIYLADLDAAEKELLSALENTPGAYVERKKFSIGIHYRNVSEEHLSFVKNAAQQGLQNYPNLKKGLGKKIIELKPDIEWDKGKAVFWLLKKLDIDRPGILPIYIGDDLTDEDAFRALADQGLGILVGDHGELTYAHYGLKDVTEVKRFLNEMINFLEESS